MQSIASLHKHLDTYLARRSAELSPERRVLARHELPHGARETIPLTLPQLALGLSGLLHRLRCALAYGGKLVDGSLDLTALRRCVVAEEIQVNLQRSFFLAQLVFRHRSLRRQEVKAHSQRTNEHWHALSKRLLSSLGEGA